MYCQQQSNRRNDGVGVGVGLSYIRSNHTLGGCPDSSSMMMSDYQDYNHEGEGNLFYETRSPYSSSSCSSHGQGNEGFPQHHYHREEEEEDNTYDFPSIEWSDNHHHHHPLDKTKSPSRCDTSGDENECSVPVNAHHAATNKSFKRIHHTIPSKGLLRSLKFACKLDSLATTTVTTAASCSIGSSCYYSSLDQVINKATQIHCRHQQHQQQQQQQQQQQRHHRHHSDPSSSSSMVWSSSSSPPSLPSSSAACLDHDHHRHHDDPINCNVALFEALERIDEMTISYNEDFMMESTTTTTTTTTTAAYPFGITG